MKILQTTTYKDVKENINIILLFPAVLGSIWQVLELASISTSFIRYFSVNQLIADGALILFFLFFGYLGLKIIKSFFKDKNFKFGNKEDEYERRKLTMLIFILTSLLIVFVIIPPAINLFSDKRLSPIILLTFIPTVVILGTLFIQSTASLLIAYGININNLKNEQHKLFIRGIFSIGVFFIGIWLLLFTIKAFHKSFLMPENVANQEYVKCKLLNRKPPIREYEILYFNDKYIFIQYQKIDKPLIEVLPFESFTESTACDSITN